MSAPLLATKLFVPPPGKVLVERPRLLEKLHECLHPACRLALVSAPAGFGKTTLVSAWTLSLRSSGFEPSPSFAWLSLDDGDNDPVIFWSYVISSLQTHQPEIGEPALNLLQTTPPSELEANLASLVNDLAEIARPFILILDDYHLIRNPAIHHSLTFFIEHVPSQFHVMVVSRTDPPLPLALLRGRGQLQEIRLADLRFSNDEAATYLNEEMKLALSPGAINTLNAKTEGWAAGLQMAALSMQGRQDTFQFIQTFSGSNRYILEYLLEEVLNRQPENIKEFLLHTSILDNLCGPLCDAVLTSSFTSQGLLEYLEHANLFLIPLDEEHHWYRYHTLFGDLVRSQLERTRGEAIPELHRKAAVWYEANLHPMDAVHHWLAANQVQPATRLIEVESTRLLENGMANRALGWLNTLPDALFKASPKLNLLYSWGLISTGQFNLVEPRLQAIECDLADVLELEALQAEIDATRAVIGFSSGDYARAIELGQKALTGLSKRNHLYSAVLNGIGTAYHLKGELKLASQFLEQAAQNAEEIQHYASAIACLCILGDIYSEQGLLHLAKETYQHGIDLNASVRGGIPVTCLAYAGLSRLYYEWNDLEQAMTVVCEALQQVEKWGNIGIQAVTYAHKALYELALGKSEQAAQSMNSATELAPKWMSLPFIRQTMYALTIRFWLRSGQVDRAYQVHQQKPMPFPSDVQLGLEGRLGEISVLAAMGHAHHNAQMLYSVLQQIDELLPAQSGRGYWLLQTRIQQVLALLALGRERDAADLLTQILRQAEPEGFVRLFVDQGQHIAGLLRQVPSTHPQVGYVQHLLAAMQGVLSQPSVQTETYTGKLTSSESSGETRKASLVEPLSDREIEVLRLIAAGFTNKEIAQKLCISLRTVKYHTTSIYTKLAVNGRAQAAIKAKELGLLK